MQGRRLRPGHRRDLRHRPGRRGHRAAGRRADVRDDAGVRRRQPAREDRHARLRRVRRHQQVRPQGRGRRAARRRQAGAAQPRGLRQAARRDAGVRHDGEPLQRRRRDRALPGAAAAPGEPRPEGRAGLAAAGRRRATARTRSPIVPGSRSRYLADIADTVRGYKKRAVEQARLAREIQQLRAAARDAQGRQARQGPRLGSRLRPGRCSARRGSTPTRASCWRCGRRCSAPTPATSTS